MTDAENLHLSKPQLNDNTMPIKLTHKKMIITYDWSNAQKCLLFEKQWFDKSQKFTTSSWSSATSFSI